MLLLVSRCFAFYLVYSDYSYALRIAPLAECLADGLGIEDDAAVWLACIQQVELAVFAPYGDSCM